jgi:hypothetical protein
VLRRVASVVSCLTAGMFVVACGTSVDPAQEVRGTAQHYLRAVAGGDGNTACALLSARGLADGGYGSRTACARDYASRPFRRTFSIVKIMVSGDHQSARVVIGDAAVSDSGNDMIELSHHGTNWLIDAG